MTPTEITTALTGVITDNKAIFLVVFPLVLGVTVAMKVIRKKGNQIGGQVAK